MQCVSAGARNTGVAGRGQWRFRLFAQRRVVHCNSRCNATLLATSHVYAGRVRRATQHPPLRFWPAVSGNDFGVQAAAQPADLMSHLFLSSRFVCHIPLAGTASVAALLHNNGMPIHALTCVWKMVAGWLALARVLDGTFQARGRAVRGQTVRWALDVCFMVV